MSKSSALMTPTTFTENSSSAGDRLKFATKELVIDLDENSSTSS